MHHRRLPLRRETLRQLTSPELRRAAGGVPTSGITGCYCAAARAEFTVECPSNYTNCINSCSQ